VLGLGLRHGSSPSTHVQIRTQIKGLVKGAEDNRGERPEFDEKQKKAKTPSLSTSRMVRCC